MFPRLPFKPGKNISPYVFILQSRFIAVLSYPAARSHIMTKIYVVCLATVLLAFGCTSAASAADAANRELLEHDGPSTMWSGVGGYKMPARKSKTPSVTIVVTGGSDNTCVAGMTGLTLLALWVPHGELMCLIDMFGHSVPALSARRLFVAGLQETTRTLAVSTVF